MWFEHHRPNCLLSLGIGVALLCHTPMTQAGIFDPILRVLIPNYQANQANPTDGIDGQNNDPANTSSPPSQPYSFFKGTTNKTAQKTTQKTTQETTQKTTKDITNSPQDHLTDTIIATHTTTQPLEQENHHQKPSLYQLLLAEFAISRGQTDVGLDLYKQQAFKDNASPVFERALQLSLHHEDTPQSLQFATHWQKNNPAHTPALFYVAHLALQSSDYETASQTLKQILQYDPKADLSQLLQGIYPTEESEQRRLLATLQQLDSEQNWSLSVLQAGLLLQFDEAKLALLHINRALRQNPDNLAVINLKADILKQTASSDDVLTFLQQQQRKLPDNKELYLAQVRHLLALKKSQQAWQLLQHTHDRFADDHELTLLAGLVGIDVADYAKAEQLLEHLLTDAHYQDQANHYLAISAERQHLYHRAYEFYANVNQAELVLNARKKMVAFALLQNQPDTALSIINDLRQQYPQYAHDADILQADILHQQGKHDDAKSILAMALQTYGNKEAILYAYTQLLDNQRDFALKQQLLTRLTDAYPDDALYVLNLAELLLDNDPNSVKGQQLAQRIADVPFDDPNHDHHHHRRAIHLLARGALRQGDHAKVVAYLQDMYAIEADLQVGIMLLSAYHGLNDQQQVDKLLTDLQQRFGYDDAYFSNLDSNSPNK